MKKVWGIINLNGGLFMEIITTTSGLKNYGASYPYTIAYIGLQRKASINDFHEGHLEAVNAAKSVADKVLVGFAANEEVYDLVFSELNMSFGISDKNDCLQWASDNGVDLVFWPDPLEMSSWFDNYNITDLKNWATNYCNDHNFIFDNDSDESLLHLMMMGDKLRSELNLERRDYRVGSWKEGITRLYHKYYVETVGYSQYVLTPCLTDSNTNIPYSNSQLVDKLLPVQSFYAQIPAIVDTYKSLISTDEESFKQNIKDSIDALDGTGVFYVIKTNVYYNKPYVESGKAYIEIKLHAADNFSAGIPSVEGLSLYPFYIDV